VGHDPRDSDPPDTEAEDATREARLVCRATAGDEDAFVDIVKGTQERLWRLAWAMLQDKTAAEDAMQETYLRAWRALSTFRGGSSLSTWLCTICMNYCRDALRGRIRLLPLDLIREPERPAFEMAEAELCVILNQVWPRLEETQREAFYFVYVLGYKAKAAAVILGVKERTINWRAHRAWDSIHGAINAEGPLDDGATGTRAS
jgi:RNA polymerase sigma-70 factor, ECF subfamily